jgi:hypothetical protein
MLHIITKCSKQAVFLQSRVGMCPISNWILSRVETFDTLWYKLCTESWLVRTTSLLWGLNMPPPPRDGRQNLRTLRKWPYPPSHQGTGHILTLFHATQGLDEQTSEDSDIIPLHPFFLLHVFQPDEVIFSSLWSTHRRWGSCALW